MKRKTLVTIVAILTGVLAVFQEQFGLSINPTAIAAALTGLIVWLSGEAALDIKRIKAQVSKFKDPKFWSALVGAVLEVLNSQLGLGIPTGTITGIVVVVLGFLFKKTSTEVAAGTDGA